MESLESIISIDSNEYVGIYNYREMPIVNLSKDRQVVKDFKLDKGCKIKVTVVNEANEPIEGAELSITSPGDGIFRKIGVNGSIDKLYRPLLRLP